MLISRKWHFWFLSSSFSSSENCQQFIWKMIFHISFQHKQLNQTDFAKRLEEPTTNHREWSQNKPTSNYIIFHLNIHNVLAIYSMYNCKGGHAMCLYIVPRAGWTTLLRNFSLRAKKKVFFVVSGELKNFWICFI